MGCGASVPLPPAFKPFPDQFNSYAELTAALRVAGMDSSQLIVGIDFTKSNTETGARSYGGKSLHHVDRKSDDHNPYWQVLSIMSKALSDFDDDHEIPVYGFGDASTGNEYVFSFESNDKPCNGLDGALRRYEAITNSVTLSGPTNFAPLIRQAIHIVRTEREFHILLIIADGQVSPEEVGSTSAAIVEASHYGLSIIMVGVGDGPWDLMDKFDDELPERAFDNFQFVDFQHVSDKFPREKLETAFATVALMEIPEQYQAIQQLGLLRPGRDLPNFKQPPKPRSPPDRLEPSDPGYGLPSTWVAVYDYNNKGHYFLNKKSNVTSMIKPEFDKIGRWIVQ